VQGEVPPAKRPKYITNYLRSRQKVVDEMGRSTLRNLVESARCSWAAARSRDWHVRCSQV